MTNSEIVKNIFSKKSKTVSDHPQSVEAVAEDSSEQQQGPLTIRRAAVGPHFPDVPTPPFHGTFVAPDTPNNKCNTDTPDATLDGGQLLESLRTSSKVLMASGTSLTSNPRTLITFHPTTGVIKPYKDVRQAFRQIFNRKWFPSGYSWNGLSTEEKLFYFEEFKKSFCWDSSLDDIMYEKFCEKAKNRYKEVLYQIKTKEKGQHTINSEILRAWQQMWNSPAYQHTREVNSRNRQIEHAFGAGMSTHYGCSRSYIEHKEMLLSFVCRSRHRSRRRRRHLPPPTTAGPPPEKFFVMDRLKKTVKHVVTKRKNKDRGAEQPMTASYRRRAHAPGEGPSNPAPRMEAARHSSFHPGQSFNDPAFQVPAPPMVAEDDSAVFNIPRRRMPVLSSSSSAFSDRSLHSSSYNISGESSHQTAPLEAQTSGGGSSSRPARPSPARAVEDHVMTERSPHADDDGRGADDEDSPGVDEDVFSSLYIWDSDQRQHGAP